MTKEKYTWQTYKEQRKIYPYETTTAYYYGPKLDFTTEVKDNILIITFKLNFLSAKKTPKVK